MKIQPRQSRQADVSERLQSGELIIKASSGGSSVIPGFVRENAHRNSVSFAPFFVRECWVNLPNATIRTIRRVPAVRTDPPSVCVTLKSGDSEQVLLDLIGALAYATATRSRENPDGAADHSRTEAESGQCRRCASSKEFCVDCYLTL